MGRAHGSCARPSVFRSVPNQIESVAASYTAWRTLPPPLGMTPAAKNVTATYFVDKEEPTGLVIHTDKDVSSETLVFVDPKTMTWTVDERRSIVFKKVE